MGWMRIFCRASCPFLARLRPRVPVLLAAAADVADAVVSSTQLVEPIEDQTLDLGGAHVEAAGPLGAPQHVGHDQGGKDADGHEAQEGQPRAVG